MGRPPTADARGDRWSKAHSSRDARTDRLGEEGDAIESIVINRDALLRCRPESEGFMTGG